MVAWSETPDGLFTRVVDEIFRCNGALLSEGEELTARAGLTAARWQILGYLADGPATVADLARRRGLRRQSVQETANRLHADGLVAKEPNPADRRSPVLHITGEGRARLDALEPRRAAWSEHHAAVVGPEQLRTTLETLRRLRASVEGGPVSG